MGEIIMHFEKADYLHRCHLRDSGYIGELPYADKEQSILTPEGDWLLKDHYGEKIAVVTKNGRVLR